MEKFNYRWMAYLIAAVILATICIQVYWNYNNYLTNKQQLINEMQIGLDNAVNSYYETLAQRNTVAVALNSEGPTDFLKGGGGFDSLIHRIGISNKGIRGFDSLTKDSTKKFTIIGGISSDSLLNFPMQATKHNGSKRNRPYDSLVINDTLRPLNFELLTSKVIISITQDTLELSSLDTLLASELHRKKIEMPYGLVFRPEDGETKELYSEIVKSASLSTTSKSSFLPISSELEVFFPDVQVIVLQRILGGILLSTLLVLAVIGSLFYLLATIRRQKQLAELKNDFISNITHEFKTPIATIHAALEGITGFDVLKDPEKARSYIGISQDQLVKLNHMVEKLLETASFDQQGPILNKQRVDLVPMLAQLVDRHQLSTEKSIDFISHVEEAPIAVDTLLLENAISNVVDNAVKYGGESIILVLKAVAASFEISVEDNGNAISPADKDTIFEKFHRVPKGNVHDVKGYGIGLYHTKKIVTSHGGQITLQLAKNKTIFKISIPHV